MKTLYADSFHSENVHLSSASLCFSWLLTHSLSGLFTPHSSSWSSLVSPLPPGWWSDASPILSWVSLRKNVQLKLCARVCSKSSRTRSSVCRDSNDDVGSILGAAQNYKRARMLLMEIHFWHIFYLEDDDDATLAMGQMTEQFECMRSMQPAEDLNCANKDCHSCKCHSASRCGGFPNLIWECRNFISDGWTMRWTFP